MHKKLMIGALGVLISGLFGACGPSKSKATKSTPTPTPVAKTTPEAKKAPPEAGPTVYTGPLDTIIQGRVLDPKTNVHEDRSVGVREGRIVIVAEP